jgi:CPA2 family monovalent cation:H+ antiporter-2
VATPALAAVGRRVDHGPRRGAEPPPPETAGLSSEVPVLISGWGAAARDLAADLRASDVPVGLVTLNPDGAAEAEARGASRRTWRLHQDLRAGRGRSARRRVVVIADDEPEHARRIASIVVSLAPSAQVVVLAPDDDDVPALHAAGVASVVLSRRAAHGLLSRAVRDRLAVARTPHRTVVDTTAVIAFRADPDTACAHAALSRPVVPDAPGCGDCIRDGVDDWVHLRLCSSCGHVACCDSSPRRHASATPGARSTPSCARSSRATTGAGATWTSGLWARRGEACAAC